MDALYSLQPLYVCVMLILIEEIIVCLCFLLPFLIIVGPLALIFDVVIASKHFATIITYRFLNHVSFSNICSTLFWTPDSLGVDTALQNGNIEPNHQFP